VERLGGTLGSGGIPHTFGKASNTGENREFGSALAMSADGRTLAAGAHKDNGYGEGLTVPTTTMSGRPGAVYLY
jgi:trimeric autotransporter adhesin